MNADQLSNGGCTITLKGDLTVSDAEALKKALIKGLLDSDDIQVRVEELQNADLSCLQLLCSGHRSAVRLKKSIRFAGNPGRIFQELVTAAGFARLTGCKLDCEKNCLWTAFEGVGS